MAIFIRKMTTHIDKPLVLIFFAQKNQRQLRCFNFRYFRDNFEDFFPILNQRFQPDSGHCDPWQPGSMCRLMPCVGRLTSALQRWGAAGSMEKNGENAGVNHGKLWYFFFL